MHKINDLRSVLRQLATRLINVHEGTRVRTWYTHMQRETQTWMSKSISS